MHQLSPQEKFVIAMQLDDSSDTSTYYVQAIIQDLLDESIVDTINLTDRGDQRFTKEWLVPKDRVGTGMYISITTKVYTDSGYTTLSDIYAAHAETYLIQDRWNYALGSGGGVDISYKKITEIVEKAVQKHIQPIPDNSGIIKVVERLETSISAIPTELVKIPDMPKTDLKPVLSEVKKNQKDLVSAISDLHKVIKAIEVKPRIKITNGVVESETIPETIPETISETIPERIINSGKKLFNKRRLGNIIGLRAKTQETKPHKRVKGKRRLGNVLGIKVKTQ